MYPDGPKSNPTVKKEYHLKLDRRMTLKGRLSVKHAAMSSVVHKEMDKWIRDIDERMGELQRERTDVYKLLQRYERKVCRHERRIIRKLQRHRMRFY